MSESASNRPEDVFTWLEHQLEETPSDVFKIEPDCESTELQIARDLYYGSSGSELSLMDSRLVRVDTLNRHYVLIPLMESEFGVLCQFANAPVVADRCEFLIVCGTIFVPPYSEEDVTLSAKTENIWPQIQAPVVHQDYFEGIPNVLLNRRVASCGRMALRYTFTESELEELAEESPEFVENTLFKDLTVLTGDDKFDRKVSWNINLTDNVVQIVAEKESGEKVLFT